MTEVKTRQNASSVNAFIESIENERRRRDARTLLELMSELTREAPTMAWSNAIGFGSYHYKYDSGREGDSSIVAFSPRKQNLVIYIMPGFADYAHLLSKLGKYKTGRSCLYINKLSDVDMAVLSELIAESVAEMRRRYA